MTALYHDITADGRPVLRVHESDVVIPVDDDLNYRICPECSGNGSREIAAPCWDDPYYSIDVPCAECSGSGNVICDRGDGGMTLAEFNDLMDEIEDAMNRDCARSLAELRRDLDRELAR